MTIKRNQTDKVSVAKKGQQNLKYGHWQICPKLRNQTQTKMSISKWFWKPTHSLSIETI